MKAIDTIILANKYRKQKKYNEAIECYNQAYDYFIEIIDQEEDSSLESISYWLLSEIELAEVYVEIDEIEIAKSIIERTKKSCLDSLKIESFYVPIINSLASLDSLKADICKRRGEITEQREFLYKSIEQYNLSLSIENVNIEALIGRSLLKSKLAKNYFYDYSTELKALNLYREAIGESTFILSIEQNIDVLENRALDRVEISNIYTKQKQTTLALDALTLAIKDYQDILSVSPENITLLNGLGKAYEDMSNIYVKIGDFDKVPKFLYQSIEMYHKVLKVEPQNIDTINNITDSKIALGSYYLSVGDIDIAIKILNEAIESSIESININSTHNFTALTNRGLAISTLAKIDVIQGKQRKAIEEFKKAIEYYSLALEINKVDKFTLHNRGIAFDMISEIYIDLKDKKMATLFYKKSLDDYNTSLKYYPNNPEAITNKVKIISDYFFYNKKEIDKQESIETLEQIISDCDKILQINPNNHDAINNKLAVFSELSAIYDEMGNESKTMEIAYQELKEYEKILKIYPRDSLILHNAGVGKFFLSEYLVKQNKKEEALFYLKESIPHFDLALELNQEDILTLTNKALSLRDIVKLSKDRLYSDSSIDTTYKLLDLYDKYFFSVEEESDTFHLIEKMLFPLSTLLYSSLYSTIDKKLVLKAIEMVKAKTLKQMLSLAMNKETFSFESQENENAFYIYKEKITLLERDIRKITNIVNRSQEELTCIKSSKSSTKIEVNRLDKKYTEALETKKELYQELNLYKNRLSNLFLNRDIFIESNYQTALEHLDEESVVLYPFCYVYPDYYKREHELYVVAFYKKDGNIEVDIHFETIEDPVIFSDYIYLTRELESIVNLLENNQPITKKLNSLNLKKSTVSQELLNEIFELDREMNILSLKIDKSDFEWRYKYEIIQKALSFVQNLCLKSIPKKRKKIYFSPFGDLNLLPLHALTTSDGSYLIEQYEIVYIPFISILDTFHLNQEIEKNLFVSIEEFKEESNICLNIKGVGGEHKIDMSATEFKSKVHNNPYNILHLSTHGLSDLDNPLNSHLQFKDSNLSLLEIHALKLDINLVILSACETNLSTINGADEVLAFERAFLIAGAKNIITTFLSVDSDRTIDFMRVFYEKTAKNNSISKTFQQTCIDDIHEHGSSEWMLFRFTGV